RRDAYYEKSERDVPERAGLGVDRRVAPLRLAGGLRSRSRRRIGRLRLALLALPLLSRFIRAGVQFFPQLVLLLLEYFRIGRRTVIGFAEIGKRQHQADRLTGRINRLNDQPLPFLHLGYQVA